MVVSKAPQATVISAMAENLGPNRACDLRPAITEPGRHIRCVISLGAQVDTQRGDMSEQRKHEHNSPWDR